MFLTLLISCIIRYHLRGCWILDGHGSLMHFFYSNQTSPPPPNNFFEMASFSSNNHFATLSSLKTPSGEFILERVSSGDKAAATGSNAIPVAPCNNKYLAALKSKVSTEPTLKRRPALILGSKKLPPNVWATLASRPGPSAPGRLLNFHSRWKLTFCPPRWQLPSKGLHHCHSLKQLKPVLPTGGTNSLNSSCTNFFGPCRTIRWTPVRQNPSPMLPPKAFKLDLNNHLDLKKVCFLLGVRLGRCLRTGFLSRRMRKTYLPHKTFRPLEPHTQFMWHGKWLMRMMMWHWEKEEEMEGIWWESEY